MEAKLHEEYGHLLDFTNISLKLNLQRCKEIGTSNLIDLREYIKGEIHPTYKRKIMEKIMGHYIFNTKNIKTKDLCHVNYYQKLKWELEKQISEGKTNFSDQIMTPYIFMYIMTCMTCSKDFKEVTYLYNLGFRLKEEFLYSKYSVKFKLQCPKIFGNKRNEICDWVLSTKEERKKYEFFKSLNDEYIFYEEIITCVPVLYKKGEKRPLGKENLDKKVVKRI